MRGKKVFTYGMPFYAGWGLTHDAKICTRRSRSLDLDALVAATLILYPRYIHPQTRALCEVEEMLEGLEKERKRIQTDTAYRRWVHIRNLLSRKSQYLLRLFGSS